MEGQPDLDSQQCDMLQALRSAALPDEFWMYSYKILPCPHGYRHSWTHCPFSHAGETARRRCPRTHHYLPDPCVNARAKRQCPNGDACPYAHNTFEQWLHPARYRTRLCYLGANCRRPTCFFAHSVEELRSVDENESGSNAVHPIVPTSLSSLPIPPPLPSPGATNVDYAALSAAAAVAAAAPPPANTAGAAAASANNPSVPPAPPHTAAAAAGPAGAPVPVGLYQPIALVCMPQPTQMAPQPHAVMRPEMMAAPGPQAYVTYDPRPGMPRPPQPLPPAAASQAGGHGHDPSGQSGPLHGVHGMPMSVSMAPQGMVPVALRPQPPRQHPVGPTVALATVQGGQVHMTPAGPVYVHGGMGPVTAAAPPPMGYVQAPYGVAPPAVAGGYFNGHMGGEGVPPSMAPGRMRSWSNPGESFSTALSPVNLPSGKSVNGHPRMQYGSGSGDKPPQALPWAAEAGRRVIVATGLPPGVSAVPASALTPSPSPPQLTRGGAAPRHMPAPTNRGNTVRRVSTPASLSAQAANAAAAAAAASAAVAAMRYSGVDGASGARSPVAALPGSGGSAVLPPPSPNALRSAPQPMAAAQSALQQHPSQQLSTAPSAEEQLETALRSMNLAGKSVAAPPPTPAASHAGGSPYPSSSPLSAVQLTTTGAPSADFTAGGGASSDFAFQQVRGSLDGGPAMAAAAAVNSPFSRPSSAGSSSSGRMAGAFDASAAATAAALAAVAAAGGIDATAPADAVAAVGVPYRALLQHVLRSASASAAEPPSAMLLPAILGGCSEAAVLAAADNDLLYDDVDGPERSSDPGPNGSLRAAIRRISTELGSAAVNRNSDPGQAVPSAAGVQQLLLPLLQTVLTEGLATGQFELVNGQLQVKSSSPLGSSGPSGSGYGGQSGPSSAGLGPVAEVEVIGSGSPSAVAS